MKLAVCLSSELRNVTYSLPRIVSFCEHYFEGYDIDYFVYAPNTVTKNFQYVNAIFGQNDAVNVNVSDATIKFVNDTLHPKAFVIESDYEKIDSLVKMYGLNVGDYQMASSRDTQHYFVNYRAFNQFHFAQQVIELKQQYEQKNNFKYDLVFRTRPDFYPLEYDHIDGKAQALGDDRLYGVTTYVKQDWPNSVFVAYMDCRDGIAQIGDWFFLAQSSTMDLYHKDAVKNFVQYHNDVVSDKFIGLCENLKSAFSQAERRWYFLGFVNRISFVTNIFIPSCLARDYYEYNDWAYENQHTKMYHHQEYLIAMDKLIRNKIHNGYQLQKIVDYFKTNSLWEYRTIQAATNFFDTNRARFE